MKSRRETTETGRIRQGEEPSPAGSEMTKENLTMQATATQETSTDLRSRSIAKLKGIAADLRLQILDQGEAIDLLLLAFLMREHLAIVGPAGEGKTLLAQRFVTYISGFFFYALLTRYSVPDEVLGHYSLAELQRDNYVRRTTGKAPEARIVVLDEVFKANSPMLNSLLGILNERVVEGIPCELDTLVGLSNEWPRGIESADRDGDDESLVPLWDRFSLRYKLSQPQSDSTFLAIIKGEDNGPQAPGLDDDEVDELRTMVEEARRSIPDDIWEAFVEIRNETVKEGIRISDRRWKKAVKAVAASAVLDGRTDVRRKDLQVLSNVLWTTYEQRPAIVAILSQVQDPAVVAAINFETELLSHLSSLESSKQALDYPSKRKDVVVWSKHAYKNLLSILEEGTTDDDEAIDRVLDKLEDAIRSLELEMLQETEI